MYAKVFRSLFYGSLHGKSEAQHVFIVMLAHADRDGDVELHASTMADLTGLSLEQVVAGIGVLESEDADSRSPDDNGRRITRLRDGCWAIVNYAKYRNMRDEDARREQNRKAKERQRLRDMSSSVSRRQPPSAQAEAEAEADTDADKRNTLAPPAAVARVGGVEKAWFREWYTAYPRHKAPRAAERAYRSALKRAEAKTLLAGALRYRQEISDRPPDKVMYPATWLNGDCWLNEPDVSGEPEDQANATVQRIMEKVAEMEANL